MTTREQFGKYILLKKLAEDPLGETFRAGLQGQERMERVVLLRIFNGPGIDGQRLWGEVGRRLPIQKILKSPNIAEGVELGELQGIPFVAYDYISGKSLAHLMYQAAQKKEPIPTEHALLITERIALALAVASENRHDGQRILHGFLTPHLVLISNEGESRLAGFEAAPGLRSFAANPLIRQHFGRYLAPEALSGMPGDRADDIYSLGVILFELLSGRQLPPPAPDGTGYGSIIDRATLATEEAPFPPALTQLLKQSLVARDHRIRDIVAWHKTLNKWMFEGQYNPTTFNLAFYMHNLFRHDIEKESEELEEERTLTIPMVAPSPAAAAAAGTAVTTVAEAAGGELSAETVLVPSLETAVIHEDQIQAEREASVSAAVPADADAEEKRRSPVPLLAGLAALLLLAVAVGFWALRGDKGAGTDEIAAADATTDAAAMRPTLPAATEPATVLPPEEEAMQEPEGPTPEELQAAQLQEQIDSMIAQKTVAMEEELRKQFDEKLRKMQQDLEAAQKAAAEAESQRQAEIEARKLAEEEAKQKEAERLAEETAAAAKEAEKPPEEQVAEISEPPGEAPDAQPKTESPAAGTQLAEAQPPQATAPPPPPPPPARPQVRRGDLVTLGAGVIPPKITDRSRPRFPEMARRVGKRDATVKVRVLVDENGKVQKTELQKKVGFGFDAEALQAARNSKYKAATKYGVPVKMWHEVTVIFKQ